MACLVGYTCFDTSSYSYYFSTDYVQIDACIAVVRSIVAFPKYAEYWYAAQTKQPIGATILKNLEVLCMAIATAIENRRNIAVVLVA